MPDRINELGQFHVAWKRAQEDGALILKDLRKLLPDYRYADRATAAKTDRAVCGLVSRRIARAGDSLFSLQQLLFELQLEEIGPEVQSLRDGLELFSGELAARSCSFRPPKPEAMIALLTHDRELLAQAAGIESRAEDVYAALLKALKGRLAAKDPRLFSKAKQDLAGLRLLLRDAVITLREREQLCNLEPASFERSFARLRQEIRARL